MKNNYYYRIAGLLTCIAFLLIQLETMAQTRNPAPYCYPTTGGMTQGTCTWGAGFNIRSVKLNSLLQTSACYGSADSDVYRHWNSTTTLISGTVYTMEIVTEQSTYNYQISAGFWIDYDQDSTFDSIELIGSKIGKNNVTGGLKHTISFSVPCGAKAGTTRLRVRSQYLNLINGSQACGSINNPYGETWDFPITIVQPSNAVADFNLPDTVFSKTKVMFVNANRNGYFSHSWDVNNDGTIESSAMDFSYTWSTIGNKCVKLRSVNCFGSDSITKCLVVVAPTAKPIVNFTNCDRQIEQYETMQLFDQSENGPYQWEWGVYDSTTGGWGSITTGEVVADPWGRGNDQYSQNPEFTFYVPGIYSVFLKARNDLGWSQKVRHYTIIVSPPTQYNIGYGTYGTKLNNVIHSNYGKIYDDGGPNLSYGGNQGVSTRSFLSIVPDIKKPVTIRFHQLRFADSNDYIRLYDDDTINPNKLIVKLSMANNGGTPTYTSVSNSMFFEFVSNNSGTDSGYFATFDAGGFGAPYCVPELTYIRNISELEIFNKYRDKKYRNSYQLWSIDDVNLNAFNGQDTLRYKFSDTASHKFCLELLRCDSTIKLCTNLSFQSGIMGDVSFDYNTNCVKDSGDKLLDNVMLALYDSNYVLLGKGSTYKGAYNFNLPNGAYTVMLDTADVPFLVSCPYPGNDSTFSISSSNLLSTIDFNVSCKSGFDIGVKSAVNIGRVFPGANHKLRIRAGDMSQWFGLACASGVSGTVKVTIGGPVTYLTTMSQALTPSVSGNTLTYAISDFANIDNDKAFGVFLKVDTSANINDTVTVKVEVTPKSGDSDTSNNKKAFRFLVVNSLDPNMKEVFPVDVPPLYDDWFVYTIHFQNTGNAAAQNIRITDTLASQLDVSSFQVLNNSHDVKVSLIENALTFRFPDIQLPDSFTDKNGSQGFIQYRVKPYSGLPKGTAIHNTAYIFFDYNTPIVTNTTVNNYVEENSSIPSLRNPYGLTVYPNPTKDAFHLSLSQGLRNMKLKVSVYNAMGVLVYQADMIGGETQIPLGNCPEGVYFIRVEGEGITLNASVIKQ